ncbi:MAG: GNAT family N-acetyltransferase [Pseudanabaenaceae cyanobacterium bins.39]|nr:GNAT family N-acetyltransferase [Pseudanabaenaceae cyanobacterium bins.39]
MYIIRQANTKDVVHLSDILTQSFYRNSESSHPRRPLHFFSLLTRHFTNWVYPLLRYGIMLDLNNRFNENSPSYVCLVATHPANKSQVIASLEICMRYIPTRSPLQCWSMHDRQEYPYIFNLAVHPQWRRRGVAKQLLLAAEDTAKQWGVTHIFMHVLEDNYAARSLYEHLGYRLHSQNGTISHHLLGRPRRFLLNKTL